MVETATNKNVNKQATTTTTLKKETAGRERGYFVLRKDKKNKNDKLCELLNVVTYPFCTRRRKKELSEMKKKLRTLPPLSN